MATLTIRRLDDSIKGRLRIQAAQHGVSMEEEARQLLRKALCKNKQSGPLGTRIHEYFSAIDSDDDFIPQRSMVRPAPDFSEEKFSRESN